MDFSFRGHFETVFSYSPSCGLFPPRFFSSGGFPSCWLLFLKMRHLFPKRACPGVVKPCPCALSFFFRGTPFSPTLGRDMFFFFFMNHTEGLFGTSDFRSPRCFPPSPWRGQFRDAALFVIFFAPVFLVCGTFPRYLRHFTPPHFQCEASSHFCHVLQPIDLFFASPPWRFF